MKTYNDYKNAIASVICIQFASDSTHSISTGGLAYNVVVPVPPSFAFPTQVLPSKHDILTSLKAIYEDQIAPAVIGRMVESLIIIDHTHMLLQGNYKNNVMLYRALMPLPPPVYDIYSYRNGFFLATTIGFCLPLVWRIRDVTTEIGSGLKSIDTDVFKLQSSLKRPKSSEEASRWQEKAHKLGLIEPNSGLVLVSGKDIRTAGFERMGFCPQFDALFADLTVSEHLSYFGGIRGLHSDVILTTTTKLLQAVRLSDKADAFPEELSGGMKRKLSIALALLTSPEVLILDEPTAALDPETRRSIWSLIKELGGDASILLSTHDMEEADVLGDRIIVMYNGSVISWGSPSFLKNACGVGYKLRIQKEQKAFKSDAVLALVKKTVPQAIIEDEKENEAIIALHTMEIRGFPAMFRELEGRSKGLGIKSTGVSVATMQDAYVK
ncbi:hypothetical protein MRX96_011397 [Rhipicephalus microplus]